MSAEDLLWQQDAIGQAEAIRRGDISAIELVDAAISRAEASQPALGAIATPLYDAARSAAAVAGPNASGPFEGVPTVWKDLGLSAAGVPITSGSKMPPRQADHDGTLVQAWQGAGLIPIATSTTSEWGLRIVTETERHGITRNPWNTGHVTGGSSGGSASLVAAGVVPVAHASDGGGSIRIPAACCGLVGLKPSRGRVPMTPDLREGWSGMVVQHAVTRSVRDSAALLDVVTAQPDPLAPYIPTRSVPSYQTAAETTPAPLRLAVFRRNPLGLDTSAEVLAALDKTVTACRDAGHEVEEIEIPAINRALITAFCQSVAANHAGNMALEAARSGPSAPGRAGQQARILQRFGNALPGGAVTSAGMRLQQGAMEILRQTQAYDAVLMPILSCPPLPCGGLTATGVDALIETLLDRLHLSFLLRVPNFFDQMLDKSLWFAPWPCMQNITGQPAISMPVHVTEAGLPVGIQAVGRTGDEATLLSLAGQLEADMGWQDHRAPRSFTP